jgi:trehalose 6-phosphate phosphatase
MIPGITSLEVIGNHGLETDGVSGWRYTRRVEEWRARAAEALRGLAGVVVENKRYSLAIHYRQCAEPEAARQAILRLADSLADVRVVGGKAVVNLIPAEAPDKGRALLSALTRLGCGQAIYLGDDDTDEDVFVLDREAIFTVRVGQRADSAARWFVPEQADVDRVLESLLELAHPASPPVAGSATP